MRAILATLLALTPLAVQAQSLEGRWLSGEWGGVRSIVEISPCEEGLCGTIVDVRGGPAPEGAIGHRIMWGFSQEADGSYSKGKLKPPGGAPQLNATITSLSSSQVVIRACVLFVCQNETMERL